MIRRAAFKTSSLVAGLQMLFVVHAAAGRHAQMNLKGGVIRRGTIAMITSCKIGAIAPAMALLGIHIGEHSRLDRVAKMQWQRAATVVEASHPLSLMLS